MKTVNVIIPTTRPKQVEKTVRSIQAQACPNLEIIKVQAKGLKPAQARNRGAKKAKGEILLFLDDDCQAQRGWLKENLEVLREPKIGAVGGKIQGKSRKYFAQVLDFSNFTFVQGNQRRELPLCSASFGIKRSVFEKVGGFDENLIIGEDVDLSFRLNKIGLKTIAEPKIKVWHDHRRQSLKAVWQYQYNNGRVKGLVIENLYPVSLWFLFLKAIAKPWLYVFFVLPFALMATGVAVLVNWKDNPRVFYLLPGIFLAKLACQVGILAWTMSQVKEKRS